MRMTSPLALVAGGPVNAAPGRGCDDHEIDGYLDNNQNEVAMRLRRNACYEKHGTSDLDANSLSIPGHAEIDQHNRIGRLLKAK